MRALLIIFSLIVGSPSAFGDSVPRPSAARGPTNPYQRTYISFGLARNYPVSFSEDDLQPGRASPTIGYLYNLNESWVLGVSGQFKIFHRPRPQRDDGDTLALLNVTHQTLYSIRLSHPMYLLAGPKILYLVPATKPRLPIGRSEDYRSESGVGLSAQLVRVIDQNFLALVYIDRWRGTGTQRLHAIETGFALAIALH